MVAPINRIPPEILSLIPDFWDAEHRDGGVIALTHVCQTWRELFTSRPSLWTHLDIDNMSEDKTRVYLERSKSSPVNLSLCRDEKMDPEDLFLQIISQVIGRLKSLSIDGASESLQEITSHLSRPAPLLESLMVFSYDPTLYQLPILTSTLFNGDLSSLRELYLDSIRTELPWRNMANLMSFTLTCTPRGTISVPQLLDFFESAPRLREIDLSYAVPTSGVQKKRLVSLVCLKKMRIHHCGPPPALLDHLVIPVGAQLRIGANLPGSPIVDLLPRSLDNLRNFSNFTTVKLSIGNPDPYMAFDGPNGQISITPAGSQISLVLESLTQLTSSETRRLRIRMGKRPSGKSLYQILLPMRSLHALMLHECHHPHVLIHALQFTTSSSTDVVCPRLEELIIVLCRLCQEVFDVKSVIKMAEARALEGKKLKTVKIVNPWDNSDPEDISELKKHVGHVEYGPLDDLTDDEWR